MIHRSITSVAAVLLRSHPGLPRGGAAHPRCPEEVSAEEVQGWRGRPLVIDVRDRGATRPATSRRSLARIDELAGFLHSRRAAADRGIVTVAATASPRSAPRRPSAATALQVRSLRGGMAAWSGRGYELEKGGGASVEPRLPARPTPTPPSPRSSPWSVRLRAQGIYMLLTLLIVLVLGRPRDSDLRLLQRGMAAFWSARASCLANFLFFHDSDQLDWCTGWHGADGSAGCPGRSSHARRARAPPGRPRGALRGAAFLRPLLEAGPGLVRRAAALPLHGAGAALVALIPWSAPIHRVGLTMRVFGTDVHWFRDGGADRRVPRLPAIAALSAGDDRAAPARQEGAAARAGALLRRPGIPSPTRCSAP